MAFYSSSWNNNSYAKVNKERQISIDEFNQFAKVVHAIQQVVKEQEAKNVKIVEYLGNTRDDVDFLMRELNGREKSVANRLNRLEAHVCLLEEKLNARAASTPKRRKVTIRAYNKTIEIS